MTQSSDIDANFKTNRRKEHKYLPNMLDIIQPIFGPTRMATVHEDCKKGFDVATNDNAVTFGLRVRDSKYLRYSNEFTVRSYHPKSARCELHKLLEGNPSYIFYAFSKGRELVQWCLINCDVLRTLLKTNLRFTEKRNKDGTRFMTIPLMAHPDLILLSSKDIPANDNI